MNIVSKRLASGGGSEKPIELIVGEQDKAAAAKDSFTTSLFGSRAPEVYASGLRPVNVDNNIVYMSRSDNFKMSGGGRMGFRVNPQTKKFDIVTVVDDGTIQELDTQNSDLRGVDGGRVMEMVMGAYQGRFNTINDALQNKKPLTPVGVAVLKKG